MRNSEQAICALAEPTLRRAVLHEVIVASGAFAVAFLGDVRLAGSAARCFCLLARVLRGLCVFAFSGVRVLCCASVCVQVYVICD